MLTRRPYRGRRAGSIENADLRISVLEEGGHIAEILDKASGVNPLWSPRWPSIEPSTYDPSVHRDYGGGPDASLLAGLMGHNLCLDIFGGPSPEEAAAGLPVHGEASVACYELTEHGGGLLMRAELPLAGIRFRRLIVLRGRAVRIQEVVENVSATDRPIGWTEHVTLGPPFLEKGGTEFRSSATRSLVFEGAFGDADYLTSGAPFDWPSAPRRDGGVADLRLVPNTDISSAFTTHLMDRRREPAFFVAFSRAARLAFGYIWKTSDFPWMGVWEENHSRIAAPWNGGELTRGMEFGVSPFPETRRQMIDRGTLFDVPTYRWLPAGSEIAAEYWAITQAADTIPERLAWPT